MNASMLQRHVSRLFVSDAADEMAAKDPLQSLTWTALKKKATPIVFFRAGSGQSYIDTAGA